MDRIDAYCERVTPDFWAEPVNAVTNLAFLIAALVLWRQRGDKPAIESTLLIVTLAVISVGSFLFHTLATRWAVIADVLPILIFQLLFLWTYVRRRIGWGPAVAAGLVIAYLALGFATTRIMPSINGSESYLPALLVLIALGLHQALTATARRNDLLVASAIFTLSLTFRSIDHSICPEFPLGTHFIWHILNAVVLYIAARLMVVQPRQDGYLSSRK